jgi:hypothetical protein
MASCPATQATKPQPGRPPNPARASSLKYLHAVKRQNGQGNQMTLLNRMTQVSERDNYDFKIKVFLNRSKSLLLRMNKVKEL